MKIILNNKTINLIYANNFFIRLKGLMFKKDFDYGIYFPKCRSIHTFFMRKKIDVIMINKKKKIVYWQKNVKRNKIIYKKEAYHTIELPDNSINNLCIGDYLEIEI